jgi:hypothetical protein
MKWIGKILFWFFIIVAGLTFWDWDQAKQKGEAFHPLRSFGENIHYVVWEVWTGVSDASEKVDQE